MRSGVNTGAFFYLIAYPLAFCIKMKNCSVYSAELICLCNICTNLVYPYKLNLLILVFLIIPRCA